MKLLFLILAIPLISFVSSDIDYSVIEENSIAVMVNGELKLQVLETVKPGFTAGKNASKLSFKGTETAVQYKKGTPLVFFTRGNSDSAPMTFSIIKLDVGEKKRTAVYNSTTGKNLETIPYKLELIDTKKKIYRVTPNANLEVGVYGLVFKRVYKGNFKITVGGARLRINPTVIEIVE